MQQVTDGNKGNLTMKAREIQKALYVICFGLILPIVASAQPIEWPESEGGNGHYYEFRPGPSSSSWAEQHLSALALEFHGWQGHLLTITSAAELTWITENLFVRLPYESVVYLGGWNDGFLKPDATCEYSGSQGWYLGAWRWITGESWGFEQWAGNEPSAGLDGCSAEFALSYLYYWFWPSDDWTGFNNLTFGYSHTGVAQIVEYDGLSAVDVPPLDHPIPTESSTWGSVKSLYR
jgi:hypothetical protein